MANGLLAKVALVANTQTEIYQITPTAQYATASIYILNTNPSIVNASIWASTGPTPGAADLLVYDTQIPASGGELALDCRLFSASERIFVRVSGTDCVVRVEGLEKV